MTSDLDRFSAAFVAAAAAPALLTGLVFLAFTGPLGFMLGFFMALVLAALHVVFLAVPIHALLRRRRAPGPVLVLGASFLIGALPLPLLLGFDDPTAGFAIFGPLGLSGGVAFLLMAGPDEADPEER
jgi:hypothetical protein